MKRSAHMPIREFSRLTGIRRENLRFYDKIGLLSPELRGDNSYRYYTRRQLDSAFLINDLRALGLGLEEIRQYAVKRSPEGMLALFREQDAHIEKEIDRLRSIQELMRLRTDMATQALKCGEGTLLVEKRDSEPVFLCPALASGRSEEDGLVDAYDYAAAQGIDISFPFGAVVSRRTLEVGGCPQVYQYYFKVRKQANAWKPKGLYAVFHDRYYFGDMEGTYKRLLQTLSEKKLRIDSNAYEEYPLDELAVNEGEQYGVRVEVLVSDR